MSRFSENLRRIRFERHMTQEEFAQLLGTTKQNISRYESGQVSPKITTAQTIADKLGISLSELNGSDDFAKMFRGDSGVAKGLDAAISIVEQSLPSNVRPLSSLHHKRVPLIGKVAAGQPILAETDYDVFVDAPIDCDSALEVEGESMVPTYLPGDIVYIKHRQTVDNGQVAVVLIDDEATLKHVYRDDNGLTLISDNPAFAPIRIEGSEHDYLAIYGVPVGYTRIYKEKQ